MMKTGNRCPIRGYFTTHESIGISRMISFLVLYVKKRQSVFLNKLKKWYSLIAFSSGLWIPNPQTRRAPTIVIGERGDCVVVGIGVGAVVGGRVVTAVVVRTVVGAVVAGAVTVNVFTPIYPFTSLKYTSYSPGLVTMTFFVNSPAPELKYFGLRIHSGPKMVPSIP